jgi:hypothetical protein
MHASDIALEDQVSNLRKSLMRIKLCSSGLGYVVQSVSLSRPD